MHQQQAGLHHELVWGALAPAGIAKYIPDPAGGAEPYFYNAAMQTKWPCAF